MSQLSNKFYVLWEIRKYLDRRTQNRGPFHSSPSFITMSQSISQLLMDAGFPQWIQDNNRGDNLVIQVFH